MPPSLDLPLDTAYDAALDSEPAGSRSPLPGRHGAVRARPRRVLIVKLTSLGDVVNTLPVVDDIHRALPHVRIDWVVERPCDALLARHPGIDRVIPLELRRYRKERRYAAGLRAALADLGGLRAQRYDLVIDLQGRMKSALVAALARGPAVGPAPRPSSEPHYHRLYRRALTLPGMAERDAVTVNRALCALALGYPLPATPPHPGLRHFGPPGQGLVPAAPYAVLVHGSSRPEKCWPDERWIETGRALARRGVATLLPWGEAVEAERARRLAASIRGGVVPTRIATLGEWIGVLGCASVVVGVDSGLTHLAAACGAPTVAIFTATRVATFGIRSEVPHRNLGDEGRPVASAEVIAAVDALLGPALATDPALSLQSAAAR